MLQSLPISREKARASCAIKVGLRRRGKAPASEGDRYKYVTRVSRGGLLCGSA